MHTEEWLYMCGLLWVSEQGLGKAKARLRESPHPLKTMTGQKKPGGLRDSKHWQSPRERGYTHQTFL